MTGEARPVTVIVPTYNRAATLLLCLQHLEAQRYKNFEVIVVDDGSTDDTQAVLADFRARTALCLRVLKLENGGPARGRNVAIAKARTELCVLIGDDILVGPEFVEAHLRLHRERPEREVVGLGLTLWDTTHQRLTPFMEWLEKKQFAYGHLLAGAEPNWRHFYTSNLSFKTSLLRETRFNEAFRKAAFEDIEVGYRLAMADQLRLIFLKDAVATHVHPTTFVDATRRMRVLGNAERIFHSCWPETRSEFPSGLKGKLSFFLGAHPALLGFLTAVANRVWGERRHTLLSAWILSGHHRRGYVERAGEAGALVTPPVEKDRGWRA